MACGKFHTPTISVHPNHWPEVKEILDRQHAEFARAERGRYWARRAMGARTFGSLEVSPEEYHELQDADFDWRSYDQETQGLLVEAGRFATDRLPPLPVVVKRGALGQEI